LVSVCVLCVRACVRACAQEATTSEGAGAHDVWDRIFSLAHAGTYIGEDWWKKGSAW
jgi:hypothetical protein